MEVERASARLGRHAPGQMQDALGIRERPILEGIGCEFVQN